METVDEPPGQQEQERIDEKDADSHRQNNKREGEKDEERLEEGIEQAEDKNDHNQGCATVVTNPRHQMSADKNAERQQEP